MTDNQQIDDVPRNFNFRLNQLISVGFTVGFLGSAYVAVRESIGSNWNVAMLAAIAALLFWQQIPTFIGDGHYWHRNLIPL
ncbi:hypothetical protein N9M17_00315 [bacterium]|jgi:hypothetical protein|nr:hypothetical protein [bacterium]MDB4741639.1 hypothetical protein [Akkermansiaceae bacterium]